MSKKYLKKLLQIFVLAIELILIIFLIKVNKDFLIERIPFLNLETTTNIDNLVIGVIGAFIWILIEVPSQMLIHIIFSIKIYPRAVLLFSLYNEEKLKDNINAMFNFIFSTSCKWGVSKYSSNKKNANIAEGLIACASVIDAEINLNDNHKKETVKILDEIILNFNEDGYESYAVSSYTVHCTSMILFAIKRFVDLKIYDITNEQETQIHNCLNKLLENANPNGWGFENRYYDDITYIRLLSTIWALRALNTWGYSDRQAYKNIFNNIINLRQYKFGFSPNTTEKKSITALFYTLIYEIKDESLKHEIEEKIDFSAGMKYLLRGNCPDIEVEEFIIEKSNHKKLSWSHFCECFVIETVSLYHEKLNLFQCIKFAYIIKNCFNRLNKEHGYYSVDMMNFNHNDPFFYPTTYLMIATSAFLQSISN